jgi:hypothetical protein
MKKLNIAIFACLSFMPFTQAFALTSPLNQSITVAEAILDSTTLQNTIPQNESIVAIRRVSSSADETFVTVEITTRTPPSTSHHHDCHHHHSNHDLHTYRVEVEITAPTGPGTISVEVLSVKRVSSHLHLVFENVEALNQE